MRQTGFPDAMRWEPWGIAQGDAGLAVFHGYLDLCFPEEGWDKVAHAYLAAAASGAARAGPLPAGLSSGLAGLASAVWLLSRTGERYRQLLMTCENALLPATVALADRVAAASPGMSVSAFDAISGLSGIAGHWLSRRQSGSDADVVLRRTVGALCTLSDTGKSAVPPRWYTPAWATGDASLARRYPDGTLNCGLAHGIPGPLAVLALALTRHVEVEGISRAVAATAQWLADHRFDDARGPNWPTVVPLSANGRPAVPGMLEGGRAAWCYGAPGVARALWLAGQALGDHALCDLSVRALTAVHRRTPGERRIDSPTFCHGVAGLLHITLRFAHDTELDIFRAASVALVDQLIASYDPARPLGFANIEPDGRQVDQPAVLDGAAGVALTLLAAATDREPVWDRLFLLS
ncbi:lanthionine synthetase C family protein [Streptomyces sp. NPDC046939]|uniref:lanthionine synthetase C family protein n=1 Tax=Streptomyces sp. NPDC046939 TaxID=3155376 RepID=UPI0034014DE2